MGDALGSGYGTDGGYSDSVSVGNVVEKLEVS